MAPISDYGQLLAVATTCGDARRKSRRSRSPTITTMSNPPVRSRSFLTAIRPATALFATAALACAQVATGPAVPATPQPLVTFSPDVLHYGGPSGQTQNPRSRVQVYGFPRAGTTIELQVLGARPNVAATFYVSTGYANRSIGNFGRILVDTLAATTHQATTDANGRATVALAVPATAQVGDEFFVQCSTIDSGSAPQIEWSSAAAFQVGSARKPIGMTSHLAGTITVAGVGATVTSPSVSGLHVLEWRASVGGVSGELAISTESDAIVVNGVPISDLRIQSGVNDSGLVWTAADFLRVPATTADAFFVSFQAGGLDFGPYVVPGTIGSWLGDVVVQMGTVPALDNNPLAGASIALDLDEVFFGPEYLAQVDALDLTQGLAAGAALTEAEVAQTFAAMDALFAQRFAGHAGDRSFYDNQLVAYSSFITREAITLSILTDGMATTSEELHQLIESGVITSWSGFLDLIWGKICAFFDIADLAHDLKEVFEEECGELAKEAKKQIDSGDYKGAAKTTGKILDKVASKKFMKKVADKAGSEAAKKLGKKIGAKCLPVIGWALGIIDLIKTFVEQWL
jgi:hypothetical protein